MKADINFVLDLFKIGQDKKIILIYQGEFNQEITKSVLAMVERNLEITKEDDSIKRKVFNVMVENLQNICKHALSSPSLELSKQGAVFLIAYDNLGYSVISGNIMPNAHVQDLEKNLSHINSLDKEGLRVLYKEIINKEGSLSEKGGAGLGFVDMARKSGGKLEYSFQPLENSTSFFTLKTFIPKESKL